MTDLMLLNLNKLVDSVIDGWIGPAFILVVAVIGLMLLWKRKFTELAVFAAIAVVAAMFVFDGTSLFGEKGILTSSGKDIVEQLDVGNFIRPFTLK